MLLALIILNIADTLTTIWGVKHGYFREANPLVNATNFEFKTFFVTWCAFFVAALDRKEWLIVPAFVYAAVILYMVAGIVLTLW